MNLATIPAIIGAEGIFTDGDWVESKDQDPEGEVRLIQLADIGVGAFLDKSNRRLTSAKARELRCTILKAGDILIARMPDPIGRACIFPELPYPCATVVDVCVVRLEDTCVDRNYVAWMLNSPQFLSDVLRHAKGSTRKRISRKNLGLLSIPLPPLEEQKRIAGILDQAAQLCRLRTRALEKLNTLGQAIFYEMFGDLRNSRFPKRAFGEIADVRLGKMLDKGKFKGIATRPYLRNVNVRWFDFDLSEVYEMEFSDKELARFRVEKGDLLICEGGEPGRCAVWQSGATEIYYQKALHRARVDLALATPNFIAFWFHIAARTGQLADFVSTATIAHLTGAKIKTLPVVVPPVELQRLFDDRVAKVAAAASRNEVALEQVNALFASLQHRAFRGEL